MRLLHRPSSFSMRRGVFLLVVQIGLLLCAIPLRTTPPDPLWIPGIYDDGDLDDVIGPLPDSEAALPHATGAGPELIPRNSLPLSPLADLLAHRLDLLALQLRSPPSH